MDDEEMLAQIEQQQLAHLADLQRVMDDLQREMADRREELALVREVERTNPQLAQEGGVTRRAQFLEERLAQLAEELQAVARSRNKA